MVTDDMARAIDFQYPTGIVINAPAAATGYGRMGAEMDDALRCNGIENTVSADTRVIATNLTGIEGFWSHQRRIVWTMWESDRLPDSFKGWFDRVDRLLVPSRQNIELFSEHHHDVQLMPLGVHARWQPRPRPLRGPIVVLAGGRGWHRKGLDLALDAFFEVDRPDTELWLRYEGRPDYDDARVADPRVRIIPRVEDETDLYARAHVFLAPSRGEGWGLMPLQAMAQGCPTILTDAHGHAEFATYATGPVRARKVPTRVPDEVGSWWEPKPKLLADCLADHIDHHEAWADVALDRAATIGEMFAWQPEQLMALAGAGGRSEPGWFDEWAEPRVHECKARERVDCEIGPHRVVIEAGDTQMWGWDVYRVLRDAHVLLEEVSV